MNTPTPIEKDNGRDLQNDTDLQNLFFFLAGKNFHEEESFCDEVDLKSLLFGLENFDVGIPPQVITNLKKDLDKKIKKEKITFDEFEKIWNEMNVKLNSTNKDIQEVSKNLYHLLFELIGKNEGLVGEYRLDETNLLEVLYNLNILQKENEQENKKKVKIMIDYLTKNREYVLLRDFENLIQDYINNKGIVQDNNANTN